MLFDTHAHLNDDAYLEDLEDTIARAKEAGVKLINIVGFDDKSIEKASSFKCACVSNNIVRLLHISYYSKKKFH